MYAWLHWATRSNNRDYQCVLYRKDCVVATAFSCASDHFSEKPSFFTHSWGDHLKLLVGDVLSCNSHTTTSQNWFDSGLCLSWPGPVFVVVVLEWKAEGKRGGGWKDCGERRRGWYSEHYVRLQTGPVWRGVLMWELWAPWVRWPLTYSLPYGLHFPSLPPPFV